MIIIAAIPAVLLLLAIVHQRAYKHGLAEGMKNALYDTSTRLPRIEMVRRILELEFAAAERGRPLTIVLFSIDNYRRVAGADGGKVGERILLGAGTILRKRTRGMNVSARFNEDGWFISVLGGSSADGANVFANKVRNDLLKLPSGPQAVSVTAAVCPYHVTMHSMDELLTASELQLDEAKADGGNKVLMVPDPAPKYAHAREQHFVTTLDSSEV